MRRSHDIIEVAVTVKHQTDKAYLVDTGDADKSGNPITQWLPKSQCEYDEADGTMQMPERLAEEKGLI